MSLSDNFKEFCDNLAIKAESKSLISIRLAKLCQRLNMDFWEIDSTDGAVCVGSFGRGTAIQIVLEVDFLFPMPYWIESESDDETPKEQEKLLTSMIRSLKKSFRNEELWQDGYAVKLKFGDGMILNIIPALENDDESFTFADLRHGVLWRTLNPNAELNAIRFGNKLTNNNLKRLCKISKAWKVRHKVVMRDLLIDTFAYNFLVDWEDKKGSFIYYDYMIRDFFKYLSEQDTGTTEWSAIGSHQPVYALGNFTNKAKQALSLSQMAIDYQSSGNEDQARKVWVELFGSYFPN